MNFLKRFPLHPFILASYPVLALAANNISWVPKLDLYWTLGVTIIAMLIILFSSWLLLRNLHRAAGITSLIILLFFTYGHVYNLVAKGSNPALWLTIIWCGLLIIGAGWIRSRLGALEKFTLTLNQISILLLLFPLVTLGIDYMRDMKKKSPSDLEFLIPTSGEKLSVDNPASLPDIYFIIMDGYARADILSEIYEFDNQPTLDYLKKRGFYIADESFANYHHTALSLSTTLNMTYIKDLLTTEGVKSYDYSRIIDHIHENVVFELTSQLGYKLVIFDAGYKVTEINYADQYVQPVMQTSALEPQSQANYKSLGLFESKYLETTALRPLLPIIAKNFAEDSRYENHRRHVLNTLTNLPMFAGEDDPYLIFAYILSPHPPFVFNPEGEAISNWRPYTVSDGSHWVGGIGTREEYIAGYRDQIQYINSLLMKAVDQILAKSETSPIIIIQSDHGPGAFFEWDSINLTNLRERMSILNAIYLPDGNYEWLYPSISSINTFRGVFSNYFGANFELVEDRAFISKWGRPYDFVDITDRIQALNSR